MCYKRYYKIVVPFCVQNGFTALHVACKKNRVAVVELLLKYGATMNTATEVHKCCFLCCLLDCKQ